MNSFYSQDIKVLPFILSLILLQCLNLEIIPNDFIRNSGCFLFNGMITEISKRCPNLLLSLLCCLNSDHPILWPCGLALASFHPRHSWFDSLSIPPILIPPRLKVQVFFSVYKLFLVKIPDSCFSPGRVVYPRDVISGTRSRQR